MGPKASALLINAFRDGGNIYGAAAMKSAAKLLRGNVITAGATVVILSSFDIANIFQGRISGKQLFKNLANTATTVAGGTGGWIGGAAVGSIHFNLMEPSLHQITGCTKHRESSLVLQIHCVVNCRREQTEPDTGQSRYMHLVTMITR